MANFSHCKIFLPVLVGISLIASANLALAAQKKAAKKPSETVKSAAAKKESAKTAKPVVHDFDIKFQEFTLKNGLTVLLEIGRAHV